MVRSELRVPVGRALQKEGIDWVWAGWRVGVGFWVKYGVGKALARWRAGVGRWERWAGVAGKIW
jgi:hypothetical protein